MSDPNTIECTIRFTRQAQSRRVINKATGEPLPPIRRLPRVTRLLALAHRFDGYLRDGVIASQSELAELGHVSAARIAQIMNLLNLATDIQEEILFLEPSRSRAKYFLQQLQPIASTLDWNEQRRMWRQCQNNGIQLQNRTAS